MLLGTDKNFCAKYHGYLNVRHINKKLQLSLNLINLILIYLTVIELCLSRLVVSCKSQKG